MFKFFFEPCPKPLKLVFGNILAHITAMQAYIRTGLGTGYAEYIAGHKNIRYATNTQITET